MGLAFWTVTYSIKGLTRLLCRIDGRSLANVPAQGPLILVCNHINFLEVPVLFTQLQPRPVTGFAKAETWESPWLGPLFNLWQAIPLRRGEADTSAVRQGLQALSVGKIVAISPEGTRSGHGRLQRGHPGVVTLALRSGAPLMPIVYHGNEAFRNNIRRLQRTRFHIHVGRQFWLDTGGQKVTRELRQAITDEIMYQLAALLPDAYRGVYTDFESASTNFLRF